MESGCHAGQIECSINQGEKALIGDLELNQKVISEYASEHGNQCFLLELYIHDVTFNTWKIYVYGRWRKKIALRKIILKKYAIRRNGSRRSLY